MERNELTYQVIGAAIEVHRELGPGKPEAAYENALVHELGLRGLSHQAQKPVPVVYRGVKLECGYRLDVLVENSIVVEAKAAEVIHPMHRAQVLTYLKLGGWRLALLLNFNVAVLKEGIERLMLGFDRPFMSDALGRSEQAHDATGGPEQPTVGCGVDCGDAEAEQFAREVVGAALEVHRELGAGLLPSSYGACLCHELSLRRIPFERRRVLLLSYKGLELSFSDEVGLVVGDRLVVSPQAMPALERVHEAELLSQLRLGKWPLGLLINFNTLSFAEGIRRIVLTRKGTQTSCV